MKKRIIVGITAIACVALCAAVWPWSAEVGDLPAEPVKAAVTAEFEAWSEETPQIFISADIPAPEAETVAKSESEVTTVTAQKETETMPPAEPKLCAGTNQQRAVPNAV